MEPQGTPGEVARYDKAQEDFDKNVENWERYKGEYKEKLADQLMDMMAEEKKEWEEVLETKKAHDNAREASDTTAERAKAGATQKRQGKRRASDGDGQLPKKRARAVSPAPSKTPGYTVPLPTGDKRKELQGKLKDKEFKVMWRVMCDLYGPNRNPDVEQLSFDHKLLCSACKKAVPEIGDVQTVQCVFTDKNNAIQCTNCINSEFKPRCSLRDYHKKIRTYMRAAKIEDLNQEMQKLRRLTYLFQFKMDIHVQTSARGLLAEAIDHTRDMMAQKGMIEGVISSSKREKDAHSQMLSEKMKGLLRDAQRDSDELREWLKALAEKDKSSAVTDMRLLSTTNDLARITAKRLLLKAVFHSRKMAAQKIKFEAEFVWSLRNEKDAHFQKILKEMEDFEGDAQRDLDEVRERLKAREEMEEDLEDLEEVVDELEDEDGE
ncbi:hypothetical protein E1B28_002960 [Marasmius oreades]|uniref:Uncharacterized protein n=1 Tax=Marasmius oreades TaxID=181124 RepID=A0A9P7UMX6_9AGAR|nr:uncharacterized protein E1B28_002960 [Marasmius oreades]KAG7085399.1 hypothetical protein E1B28_002960 [Marasmius oreades]